MPTHHRASVPDVPLLSPELDVRGSAPPRPQVYPLKPIAILLSLLAYAQGTAQHRLTITEVLSNASRNRASIQSARLRLEQAQLSRRSLTSSFAPSIQLGYSTDVQTGGTDDDLMLAQQLDLFGRRTAFRSAGDAQIFQAEVGLRKSMSDLQAEVVGAYLASVASSQRINLAKRFEDLALKLSDAVRGLVEGGRLPGVQAVRADIELEKQRVTTRQRTSDYTANLKRLVGVTGLSPLEISEEFPSFPATESSVKELEGRRVDLLSIKGEIREAQAEGEVAKTERMPQFEIQARKTPWQANSQSIGARFQFSFPIDTGRTRYQESAAKKKAEAASKSYDDALRLALSETEAASIEIEGARGTVQGLESILAATDSLVERTQVGLKEGANTLIDVLDALRAKREIEESLIDARFSLAMAHARYLQAAGIILGEQK